MKHQFTLLTALGVLTVAAPAAAQDSAVADSASTSQSDTPAKETLSAEYSAWGESLDMPTFGQDTQDKLDAVYQRARVDVGAQVGSLALRLESDLFQGRLFGDEPPAQPAEFAPSGTRFSDGEAFAAENFFDPRNVYVEYRSIALARIGLQTSNFGMGLVANDGAEKDWDIFGQRYGGDRAFRALFGARPMALVSGSSRKAQNVTVAVGGDFVYRDDNASFVDGDEVLQFISSIYYSDKDPRNAEEASFLGLYFAYRNQTDFDGDELRVAAIDSSGRRSWNDDSQMWYYALGYETALLTGKTNRAYTTSGEFETGVLALGAAGEAEVRWKPVDLSMLLKAGYASGDANSDDDTLYRFRFDPNYKVGLILFDHYLPAVTRAGYTRATDATRSGAPPKGVEGLIADGAVENAYYLNPQLLFGDPEGLLTAVGVLWAQSAVPLADPFNTFTAGGVPTGVNGNEASRDLGVEIDVAARYRHNLVAELDLEVKAEYGIFFPGEAFDDLLGNSAAPQNLVRARLGVNW